jgi:hypothetical protein
MLEFWGAAAPNKGWRDFLLCAMGCWMRLVERWPTSVHAKIMTARSPDDSAGEHNKGSRWTASF